MAVADSQADHYTPGTPAEAAEAAEGSILDLDQAVALCTHTPSTTL